MRVKIDELAEKNKTFSFELKPSDLNRLDEKYHYERVTCKASFKKDRDIVLLKGEYQVTLNTQCDFCFSPAEIILDEQFELDFMPEESRPEENSDIEIPLNSRDIEYYQGSDISLAGYYEDQILLDLPMSVLCSETCLGSCPHCGANKNTTTCDCAEQNISNPFKVLKDLNLED